MILILIALLLQISCLFFCAELFFLRQLDHESYLHVLTSPVANCLYHVHSYQISLAAGT